MWTGAADSSLGVCGRYYLHVCALSLLNLIWPSLLVEHIRFPIPHLSALKALHDNFKQNERELGDMQKSEDLHLGKHSQMSLGPLIQSIYRLQDNEDQVSSFAANIVTDIERNWTVREGRIGIKTPARGGNTQTVTQIELGTVVPERDSNKLMKDTEVLLVQWLSWWDDMTAQERGRRPEQRAAAGSSAIRSDMLLF